MSSSELLTNLREARQVELALFTDLSDDQLLGPKAHFLEPPIWEVVYWSSDIGHPGHGPIVLSGGRQKTR